MALTVLGFDLFWCPVVRGLVQPFQAPPWDPLECRQLQVGQILDHVRRAVLIQLHRAPALLFRIPRYDDDSSHPRSPTFRHRLASFLIRVSL